jgi:L-ectoine synthase
MGFSFHDTILHAGTVTEMEYKHHLEAVYCIAGDGELESLVTGERWKIAAGTVYALDKHDRHRLHAHSELRMICAFNPPLTGKEVHGPDGAYPPDPELATTSSSEGNAR